MASKGGKAETEQLRKNISDQLDRLVKQLADLEEYREDLEADEYEEMKSDTKEQLQEFSQSLTKITSGNMTLVDEFSALRLAIQAAISDAFRTPEIITMFAKRQPAQIRIRLTQLERDYKFQKVSATIFKERKVEILLALKKLGDTLSPEEENFLSENSSEEMWNFEKASSEIGSSDKILSMIGKT